MARINNSSYFERLYHMDQMRQASGCFGDKRDIPIFTCSGREQMYQQAWTAMGGTGSFKQAAAMAKIQRQNNQTQYTMDSIQCLGNMMQSLSSSIMGIFELFGKKSS